ncbi:GIY-YIG nuclease family protein [Streptomyces niveus]|uniref:GIY-YIG nuclease family protein n=1 Tax=Streptomyces niveus TaxID=193462 RepID=UPI0036D33DA7
MPELPERTELHRLYGARRSEGIPPFLRQLYPQFLHYWQLLGTGAPECPLARSGYSYAPAEDPEAFLNYELEIHWPEDLHEESASRTALYRLRTSAGLLLYVGISDDPLRRWPEHAKDKPWFSIVANFATEWFESREAALDAERSAIRSERPLHNVLHNQEAAR